MALRQNLLGRSPFNPRSPAHPKARSLDPAVERSCDPEFDLSDLRAVLRIYNSGMYARVTISDWHTTIKTMAGLYPRWIFRGQSSARWGLQTTLERAAITKNSAFASSADHLATLTSQAIEELPGREAWILHQFRRRAHLVMPGAPPEDSLLDWLAAIQHFGGPTRLLDFTHSFYVALFFALEVAPVAARLRPGGRAAS